MQKRKLWFGLAALAAAISFDYLFWGKSAGVSFLVWTALLLVLGYLLAWFEKKKPSGWSIILTVLILGFATISAWRSEGFTRFTSIVMTLLGFLLLISSFLDGFWPHYRVVDYIIRLFTSIGAGFARGFQLLNTNEDGVPNLPGQKSGLRRTGSILLGILLAIPVVALLGAILSSADPIFGDLLKQVFSLENLPEYLFRFTYIVFGGYFILGLLLHAVLPNKNAEKPDTNKASLSPFLGWTECAIVLAAIDALFITFVVIQVKYLFGGQANINTAGYTYSDYARRGFGELVAVAVITLALYLMMYAITKRETKGARVGFTVLSVVMFANVLVMLASSLQRLMLYESAYSFSELRTYTHVFIYWLAALILAVIVMQIINRQGRIGLALMLMTVGFTASLGIMNVDGFVVRQNVNLAIEDQKPGITDFDYQYFTTLSTDAVPEIVKAYNDPDLPEPVHTLIGASLACRTFEVTNPLMEPWQSLRFGDLQAYRLLQENRGSWSEFIRTADENGSAVRANGVTYSCYEYGWMD
jgi:hypothetical protein